MSNTPPETPLTPEEVQLLKNYEEELSQGVKHCENPACDEVAQMVQVHGECEVYVCPRCSLESIKHLIQYLLLEGDEYTTCAKCKEKVYSLESVAFKYL